MSARILVVEDEEALTTLLRYNLETEGYEVETVERGDDADTRLKERVPDLVVLDWMMPGLSGIELCRRLRARPETKQLPIIMLTARGEDVDRILGLEMGADDYLAKPFNPRELVARVHAILRRAHNSIEDGSFESDTLVVGDVELDSRARVVRRDGELIEMTTAEFDLLRVLLHGAGQVVPREQLFQEVLGREFAVFDRSIDNHVSSLRRKLGARVNGVDRIKSVRNVGYQYAVASAGK